MTRRLRAGSVSGQGVAVTLLDQADSPALLRDLTWNSYVVPWLRPVIVVLAGVPKPVGVHGPVPFTRYRTL
jgi:hypothetical protein